MDDHPHHEGRYNLCDGQREPGRGAAGDSGTKEAES